MRTIIHRSSALRASTDAYGAGILRMLHIFYLMVFICDPLILALSEKQLQAWHPDRGAFFIARVSRHEVPKTPGKKPQGKIYGPARVSHSLPDR